MTKEEKQEQVRILQELLDSDGWKLIEESLQKRVELLTERILNPLMNEDRLEEMKLQAQRIERGVLVEVLRYPAEIRAKLVKELEEKPKDLSVY